MSEISRILKSAWSIPLDEYIQVCSNGACRAVWHEVRTMARPHCAECGAAAYILAIIPLESPDPEGDGGDGEQPAESIDPTISAPHPNTAYAIVETGEDVHTVVEYRPGERDG